MAESSRRMKSKESKATKKTKLRYVRDEEESDDDRLDLGLLDVEPDNFNPTSNLCDDPFLNILCDDKMLKNNQFEGDDEADVADVEDIHQEELEHEHLEDENGLEVGVEFRVHDPTVKWNQMKPTVGELYESPAQLRFALTNYAVANGYQLWFMKSDKSRVIVRCGKKNAKKPCPFRIHASWKYNERTFQIKSMVETHLCARNYNFGHLVSCNWLAKHYIKDIIRKPKMTLPEMMEDVLTKYSVKVSKGQCHRARVRAREMIEGKLEEHYAKIWDYANEILRSNPGSTCKVGVSVNPDGVNYFERFYVCFKALKDGWNTGCRRVIGLDGCFLKGQIKGEILTAIGRDANNHVYPIAWAVVNVENKENWTWFLQLLVDDLGVEDGRGLVVISDQHKGLLESVKAILPHVEHRQCARHIYANFRKRHTGRPRRGGEEDKQKAVKLVVKRKKKIKKAGEGSSNQDGQGGVETANDATVQEENGTVQETVQETAPKIVNDGNAISDEIDVLLQKCGYEPHEIEQAIENLEMEMGVDANADLEEDVNEIEDNLLEENLEMGVDVNEIVPPVQEVAIQGLDANAWVGEDDGNIDFIEDTQVVGRPRKRKISERIVKIKLKKAVYDKDGRGSSIKKPVNLE
ncbi:unnamed protein product [Lactuca saligna]|uniref:MULE transposase domain-containing protein n=1 Tax=Lactuca saligna TaxID=75948 RepID=A0AA36DVR4_LACSI|nr:unnamed protein product [Lactuca saligna]